MAKQDKTKKWQAGQKEERDQEREIKEGQRERERGGVSRSDPPFQQNKNAGSLVKECGMSLKGWGYSLDVNTAYVCVAVSVYLNVCAQCNGFQCVELALCPCVCVF